MIVINPNNDNGSITLKACPYREGFYMPDKLHDRECLRFIGLTRFVFRESEIDKITILASQWGFDIREVIL